MAVVPLALAFGGIQGGLSMFGAADANRKAAAAGSAQLRQLYIRAADDTRQRTAKAQRDRGAIGVIAGGAGQTGQSYVDALMSVAADSEADLRFIRFNRNAAADAVRAGVAAQQQNPLIAGFSGFLQGAGSGASIGAALK